MGNEWILRRREQSIEFRPVCAPTPPTPPAYGRVTETVYVPDAAELYPSTYSA